MQIVGHRGRRRAPSRSYEGGIGSTKRQTSSFGYPTIVSEVVRLGAPEQGHAPFDETHQNFHHDEPYDDPFQPRTVGVVLVISQHV
eukprot:scaffold684_cov345-Pavlova_lutheri.AAC.5